MKTQPLRPSKALPRVVGQATVREDDEQKSASGRDRWTAVQRVRLPNKVGLPLSSGGCGDSIER